MKTKFQFEITDTFGGDANYSWVKREEKEFKSEISDRALVREAKKWAGFTGYRCKVENMGDLIAIRPNNICQIILFL